jgi:signal transduction histidine kinase
MKFVPPAGGTRVFAIIRDITERKRLEEERVANAERAKELEHLKEIVEFKTRFMNMAAHELFTPLTPLKLQLALLKTGKEGERAHALAILDRNVDRLTALTQDLLEAARIQAGALGLAKARVDLAAVVAEAVEPYKAVAQQKGIALELDARPTWVSADARRVGQVVGNLVSNALKFTPRGGRVRIHVLPVLDGALVRVVDTGDGLRAEDVKRLFQPFTQVHDATKSATPGTGLGLYICRAIVELHHGRIWCESDGPGRGSAFAFELPRGEVPSPDAP